MFLKPSSGRWFLTFSKWMWSPRLPSTGQIPLSEARSSAHQSTHCVLPHCPAKGQPRLCPSALPVVFSPWLQQGEAPNLPRNRDAFLPASPAHTRAWGSPSAETKEEVFLRKPLSVHPCCHFPSLAASSALWQEPGQGCFGQWPCQPCHWCDAPQHWRSCVCPSQG